MQLLFPGFLAGLGMVAIPVIIHLLQLRRLQRVRFTNTEFIRELELTAARQRQIKQWVILALRALALVFLVLAFCQPFIPAQKQVVAGPQDVQVLVDTSPSMQSLGASGLTHFQEAVRQAQRLGQTAGAQARFGLLNHGSTALSRAAYQAKLQSLVVTGRAEGLARGLGGQVSNPGSSVGPVYVFSDFQRNQVSTALFAGMDKRREVVLVPSGGKLAANVYVDSVWLDDAFVRPGTNVALHVRLRNGGRADATDCPVKVFIGPQQVAAFRTTIMAGKQVASVVQVQVPGPALIRGRVVTEDAPVRFDNEYYFTLQPATQIKVLEIGAEPLAERLYQNEPVFSYSFKNGDAIDYGGLKNANLVLLHEVSQLAVGLREALRGLVRRGGSLVVVPPAEAKGRESYQQLFRELGVGVVQWEPVVAAPELREVAMPTVRNAFFKDVFGAQSRPVTMPRAAPVLRWGRTDEDILKFRDGESYLAGFQVGAGRVYTFSAPFAARYSDFAAHALFVPVLYRLAMRSYRNDQLPAYRLTQPALTLTVPPAARQAAEASYRLVKDSLTLILGQRLQGQELRLELPIGLAKPGFYELRRQDELLTTLAFNQDKRESELATYSAAELRALLGTYPNVRVLEGDVEAALVRDRAEQTGQPLWRYCVALTLLCLLAEGLLLRVGARPPKLSAA